MGVMMQAFYWDCPRAEQREFGWWEHVRAQVPDLARAGIDALWLPPVHKAANITGPSMGYDPYDYWDLGEFDQKGGVPTWFGTRRELEALIADAHGHGMQLLADIVINHNSGADATEVNPISGQERWSRFEPRSGKFARDWTCFHPSPYERWDEGTFGDMMDLSHGNPYVYGELLALTRWLVEEIGFDGFRYDFVKGYGAHTVAAIQEYRYLRAGRPYSPYGVAEYWDNTRAIESWVETTNFSHVNPVDAFDFPLRELLKSLCDEYGFCLRALVGADTLASRDPLSAVTFVENHDLRDPGRPIERDKMLAYGWILAHEGYPCVFWKDWFVDRLAAAGTPNGIAALVGANRELAGGGTDVLHVDDDLYVMQRTGWERQPGLVFALNNRGDRWNGTAVTTRWPGAAFEPVAWWSASDLARPAAQLADANGRAEFWAPPRGYVVYAPRR